MSEHNQNENQNQDGQKTLVSFVVGLLIGGLIVWMFTGSTTEAPTVNETPSDDTSEMNAEEGNDTNVNNSEENSTTNDSDEDSTDSTPQSSMEVGDGSVTVDDQTASDIVALDAVTYPMADGWIGVTDYTNDRVSTLLGVARFSEEENLVPENIQLLRSTEPGKTYAIVFYKASASNQFSLAANERVDGVFATFTAE